MVLGDQVFWAMWKLGMAVEKNRFVVLMILQMMTVREMVGARLLLISRKHLLVVPQHVFMVWTIPLMIIVNLVLRRHRLLVRQATFGVWTIPPMMVLESALVL
jgi:hypothetical protein